MIMIGGRPIFSISRLREPLGFLDNRKDKWQFIAFVSSFSALFLILFQPFGVNNYDPTHTIRPEFVFFMALFGAVNAVVLALNEFLLAPLLFRRRNGLQLIFWTGWILLVLSSTSFFFYNFLGGFHDWHFSSFRGFIWDVSNMEVIPITFAYLHFYNRQAQQKLQLLQLKHQTGLAQNELVHFESDNARERFAIHWNQLLYLESQDNYVAVHYLEGGELRKKLIRSTLKKLERAFSGSPLIRCHRSYMANMAQVTLAEGNVHQLKLTLGECVGPLPVSRNYVSEVNINLERMGAVGYSSLMPGIHP